MNRLAWSVLAFVAVGVVVSGIVRLETVRTLTGYQDGPPMNGAVLAAIVGGLIRIELGAHRRRRRADR